MKLQNLWCLIHLPSRRRFDHLTLDAARTLLQAVGPQELGDWMVWTAPWPEWKGLDTAPILFSHGHKDLPTVANHQQIKRRYDRFPQQWRVLFPYDGRVFRTTTANISQGGFFAINPLPESFVRREVEVLLSPPYPGENIRILSRIVSPHVASHFGFLDPDGEAALRLAQWLKAMIEKKVA